jgi:serine/threonine-protein kinase RsbW
MSVPNPVPEIITLTMPSRLELLGVLDQVVLALCQRFEFDEDTCSQITLSVIEAGTNAIQHGHKKDATKLFDTRFEIYLDRMEIVVKDSGTGFVPEEQNGDVTSPEHLLDARGRGLFIMRTCMDSVDFHFGDGGTECRLIKRRPVQAG